MSDSKPSSLIQLFRPTQYVPMRDCLYQALDVRSIIRLAQTSKNVRGMIYSDQALWNINKRLARFFDNSIAFRSQLGLCDGLIAGSFPLQFFENVHWPDSDIDLYVKWGESAEAMHIYLIQDGKYSQSPSENLPETEYGGYDTTDPHGDVVEVSPFTNTFSPFSPVSFLSLPVHSIFSSPSAQRMSYADQHRSAPTSERRRPASSRFS